MSAPKINVHVYVVLMLFMGLEAAYDLIIYYLQHLHQAVGKRQLVALFQ